MKVAETNKHNYQLSFDDAEVVFLDNESKDNQLTIIEMFEMVMGGLFIGGFANIIGKEKANDVEG